MDSSADESADTGKRATGDHWGQFALLWRVMGPPLRPSQQEVGFYAEAAGEWMRLGGSPRVLLLGVTPEIYHLPWPEGTDFLAVDHTQAMIDHVWPGPPEAVRRAEWLDMGLPTASRDIVFCDGGLNLLKYPDEQKRLAHAIGDVLSDGGLCVLRLFVPPPQREEPGAILDDLLAGRIPNLNVLKLRLWMALRQSADEGVALRAVWRTVHDAAGDLEALAARIGWPVDHMLAINAYRESPAQYYLPTADEVTELFCGDKCGFDLRRVCAPDYELGRQCPTIVLGRLPRGSAQ